MSSLSPGAVLSRAAAPSPATQGAEAPEEETAAGPGVGRLVFPVAGPHRVAHTFGLSRGRDRKHAGVDIMAEKGVPVVAVADGVVRWVFDGAPRRCCSVAIDHDDGWQSRYIHLDNDTPGTDDGRLVGIAPGIVPGRRVSAGQLVGWVGDSGNAEETASHLHFELRRPGSRPVDPVERLAAAYEPPVRLLVPPETAEERAAASLRAAASPEERRTPMPDTLQEPVPGGLRGWGWSCARLG